MKLVNILGHLFLIVLLTLLTQVGGLIWLLAVVVSKLLKQKKRYIFPVLYLLCNSIIIPPIAKYFGREQLPVFEEHLKPRNWMYHILFRNYVNPELKQVLEISAEQLKDQSVKITYLDANFPFFDGFPLLPHLSHNDGKKIDLSFQYLDENAQPTDKKPSVSGYGVFANSANNITSRTCLDNGYWQYDYPKYLTFGSNQDLSFDPSRTTLLIKKLLSDNRIEKVFIEPHLKQTLGLTQESKIRFHGCRAVRHDDHIHLQIQ